MFSFIKNTFQKIYTQFASKISLLLGSGSLDKATLDELERLLITADTGVATTRYIIDRLQKESHNQSPQAALHAILFDVLNMAQKADSAAIILLVGINGSGKTTAAGKLAQYYKKQGKRVLLIAADTFRAGATEQLALWAQRVGVDVVEGKGNQDPASIVFQGCQKFQVEKYDILIIDTAGRLQTKINLMSELEKIKKVIIKCIPNATIQVLLVIDAMLGQNSFQQTLIFNESVTLSGVILTKMDSTAKGGIIFSIAHVLHVPVLFVCYGEAADQIMPFDAHAYVSELLEKKL